MSSSSFAALASKPAAEKEKASVPETPPLHSVQIDGSVILQIAKHARDSSVSIHLFMVKHAIVSKYLPYYNSYIYLD